MNRFDRQIILKDFSIVAQEKLQQAKVLVVGAGGLGCPVLMYLAAAGVGQITIIDGDVVQVSNLNRQVLFGEQDFGKNKAIAAKESQDTKYSDINIVALPEFLTTNNCVKMIKSHDLVIDGTDNFATRYLINDACVLLHKPLVFGAIYQNEGQVALFNIAVENGVATNYRDVFPHPPKENQIPNCNETGVLGVLPGMIGVLMATEAIKYLTGFGTMLKNKLLVYDFLRTNFHEIELVKNPTSSSLIPATIAALEALDYGFQCQVTNEISWQEALRFFQQNEATTLLVDVREIHEQPKLNDYPTSLIPLKFLSQKIDSVSSFHNIFIFCQSGIRSKEAVTILYQYFPDKKIVSIKGGIHSYVEMK